MITPSFGSLATQRSIGRAIPAKVFVRWWQSAYGCAVTSLLCGSSSAPTQNPAFREILLSLLELTEEEAYELPGSFDFNTLWTLAGLDLSRSARSSLDAAGAGGDEKRESILACNIIQRGDMLVHVPYESFDASVERFIREGTADPSTLGVKMTVYRVGDDTPFVRWLIARGGKRQAGRLRH